MRRPRPPADPPDGRQASPPEAAAAAERVARDVVLRKLTAAPRSRAELASAIGAAGVDEATAARVLDRFTELGLVNDADYAAMLVRSRHATRGLVGRALAQELAKRGIDRDTAADALAELDDEDAYRRAVDLVGRRWPALERLGRDVAWRRMAGQLARKGYSGAVARRAIEEVSAAGGPSFESE